MILEQFKKLITANCYNSNLVIAKCEGNGEFVFHQYLNAYAEGKGGLDIEYIDDISQINANVNLFYTRPTSVKVLCVDKLSEIIIPQDDYLWIKAKKIDKKLLNEFEEYIVEIPKLEPWQIKDYVMSICEELSEKDVDYFLSVYKDNIFRIDNELSKLTIFPEKSKAYKLLKDQLYTDVTNYNVFDLSNALLKHDKESIKNILLNIDNIDVDAFGLMKILSTNFKKVIDIQLNPKATAESLKMSSKQFWAIKKYSCGYYTREQLISIYTMLNDCDYYIKSGYIDSKFIVSYIITKIMTV